MNARNNKPRFLAIGILILTLAAASACVPANPQSGPENKAQNTPVPTNTELPPASPTPAGDPGADSIQPPADPKLPGPGPVMKANELDVLVSELRVAGAQVEIGDVVKEPYFDVAGQALSVDGKNVYVFDFRNLAARQSASGKISPDGFNLGTSLVDWVDQPNFWAKGQLIVLYVGKDQALIDQISAVLGAPITHPQPAGSPVPQGQSPAVLAAEKAVSEKLGISTDKIELVSTNPVEWPDSCLGLPKSEEMCAQMVTPGYEVTLKVEDMLFVVHTNEDGSAVRMP